MRSILLVFLSVLFVSPAYADANYSPHYYYECLNRDMEEDLEALGAPDWAKDSIKIVMSGNIGKHQIDIVQVSFEEIAIGWAHFTAQRDPFGLNFLPRADMTDHHWWWETLAFLYSDHAPLLQYIEWRGIVDIAINSAPDECRDTDSCIILVASMANSSPSRARRIGHTCDWEQECMAVLYAEGSDHRQRRINAWREIAWQ